VSDKDKGGDKTELPTPQKLREARKQGDIAKGKEITPTLVTFGLIVLLMTAGGYIATRVAAFAETTLLTAASGDFALTLSGLGGEASLLLISLSAIILIPLAAIGVMAEAFQTKGLFATKKLSPKMENMNPVEGFKRLFGKQGLIELVKTLAKVGAIIAIVWFVARGHIDQLGAMLVPATAPVWQEGVGMQVGAADARRTFGITLQVLGSVAAVFVLVALVDYLWARQQFIKKMMMSRSDIRDEVKKDEGDPHIKGHRRQMAQEWAQSGAVSRTADASALLVNPTHLAIALEYDPATAPIPMIIARGEGDIAAAMRDVAVRTGVPIIRHVPTARSLWARGELGEMIPEDMFDAIAEVILWAQRARAGQAPMECDLQSAANDAANDAGNNAASAEPSAPVSEPVRS
jgi:type III secretion protein U